MLFLFLFPVPRYETEQPLVHLVPDKPDLRERALWGVLSPEFRSQLFELLAGQIAVADVELRFDTMPPVFNRVVVDFPEFAGGESVWQFIGTIGFLQAIGTVEKNVQLACVHHPGY